MTTTATAAMAVPIVDAEAMAIAPGEETKVPFAVKLLGKFLRLVDFLTYRNDGTVNRKLQRFLETKAHASSEAVNGISTKDVVIDAGNDVWLRVFTPAQEEETSRQKTEDDGSCSMSDKKLPLVIFYHGGGFVGLSADANYYDNFCRKIANSINAVVLSVNYRTAPEYPYPAAYDDCFKAFDWLRSPDSRSDLPPTADISQCFLLGDSAGGNIVHFMGCRAAEIDVSPVTIRGMVELQPFFGGEELTESEKTVKPPILPLSVCHWAWRAFLPGESRDHPASNVLGPNSPDISGLSLPPILVVIGSLDILKDRQASYVKKLQEMGKDVTVLNYAGGYHAFYIIDYTNLTEKVMADVYDFIRSGTLQR